MDNKKKQKSYKKLVISGAPGSTKIAQWHLFICAFYFSLRLTTVPILLAHCLFVGMLGCKIEPKTVQNGKQLKMFFNVAHLMSY